MRCVISYSDCFEKFFQLQAFAVVGAAKNRDKYGIKVCAAIGNTALRSIPSIRVPVK
jgi:hypothetical protein